MPIPCFFLLAYATGVLTAMAARSELRLSPRPAILCHSFFGYILFLSLLFIPVSIYFYVFHCDWSLLYLVDARTVPSAISLLGCFVEASFGIAGFVSGSAWIRTQRSAIAVSAVSVALGASAAVLFFARHRLQMVGTYAQFQAGVGLMPYTRGSLLQGTILMGILLCAGFGYLINRLLRHRID